MHNNIRRNTTGLLMIALVALFFFMPELAFAQDAKSMIAQKGKDAYDLVYTGIYSVLGLGLLIAFGMASFGRMEWSRVGMIVIGIVGAGATTAIVQYFQ